MTSISIIICTRNRADDLRNTLRSLADTYVPTGWNAECIIVDNRSTDGTQRVIEEADLRSFDVRIIEEKQPGKAHAANRALAHARGDILLFTDDDVRVPRDWLVGMAQPIRAGDADAVAGGVAIASHLERSWQEADSRLTALLADTSSLDDESPQRLVGANMAIARNVFDVVPGFDVKLGPGSRLGLGEETLLSKQIRQAGFLVKAAPNVVVEHHCSAERLSRASYLKAVERVGRSEGYIAYHWKHVSVPFIRVMSGLAWKYLQLGVKRILIQDDLQDEGLPVWELTLLMRIYHRRQLLAERGSHREYDPSRWSGASSSYRKVNCHT